MRASSAWSVILQNVRRNRRAFALSSVGILVGVSTFVFFIALSSGVKERVLNRIYPVNQIEVEPAMVQVMGVSKSVLDAEQLDDEMVATLRGLPAVTAVYPKMRSRLQARLWGGKSLFGHALRTEAFFDGLEASLLSEELQEVEGVAEKRARDSQRSSKGCKRHQECSLGDECRADGTCGRIEYWSRFSEASSVAHCEEDSNCSEAHVCIREICRTPCVNGACSSVAARGARCVVAPGCTGGACPAVCLPSCERDSACLSGQACVGLAGQGTCQAIPCQLAGREALWSDLPADVIGRRTDRCANAVEVGSAECLIATCPQSTTCATSDVTSMTGYCEPPIPVVLSPFLIEVFNTSVASALGFQPLDGVQALLGVRFKIHLGASYFSNALPKERQAVRVGEVIGFSSKALDFGLTVPMELVRSLNTRFMGREAARTYDTFVLETAGNEDMSGLIASLEARGFELSRKSRDARKAADLLFILTVVFGFISFVIVGIAAVNITHTFLVIVSERRYEIGVMRALGATQGDIRSIVLGEAVLVGLVGGVLGECCAFGASALANWAASQALTGVPFKPDDFFVYDPAILIAALLFSILFCVVGAWIPARRAARVDPARVLVT
jgi:ABC-type lipoprotein release transport system permease subunit